MKATIAYFTDAHLGQRLVMGGTLAGTKMHYDHEPEQHWNNLRLVLADVAQRQISEVVFGGDIGAAQAVGGFFDILGRYPFTTSVVLGNHDSYGDVIRYWPHRAGAVDGKMCYLRDAGAVTSIFLDTSDNSVGDAQLAWLAHELERPRTIALFIHHPLLEIDTPLDRAGAALKDRDKLKALLGRTRCDIVAFCGHYHMEDEQSEDNIRQFVTPAVSYQIVKRSERIETDAREVGYRIIEIDGGGISTEIVKLAIASSGCAHPQEG